jgi:OOP family OmpA-OmpF porin
MSDTAARLADRRHMLRISIALLAVLVTLPAAADPKFKLDGQKLIVPGPITYDTGKATVKSDSDATLVYVKAYLKAKKKVTKLRIEVHTDSSGADEYNLRMSSERALAVARALVVKGVDCARLVPVGFGETRPIASNKTLAGRAQNRRTDFVNAELSGKAIDDAPIDGGGVVAGDPCGTDE